MNIIQLKWMQGILSRNLISWTSAYQMVFKKATNYSIPIETLLINIILGRGHPITILFPEFGQIGAGKLASFGYGFNQSRPYG